MLKSDKNILETDDYNPINISKEHKEIVSKIIN